MARRHWGHTAVGSTKLWGHTGEQGCHPGDGKAPPTPLSSPTPRPNSLVSTFLVLSSPRLLVPAGPGLETACPLFALRGLASLLPNALGFFWSRGWGGIFCCLAPRHGWYSEGSRKPEPDKCRA